MKEFRYGSPIMLAILIASSIGRVATQMEGSSIHLRRPMWVAAFAWRLQRRN
jgi:hypothetical protein